MADVRRDLIALARLAPRPVRPDEAAAALGVEVGQVVDVGDALVTEGVLEFREGGFAAGAGAASAEVSAVRDAQLAGALAEALKSRGGSEGDVGRLFVAASRWGEARDALAGAALADGVDQPTSAELAGLALEAQDRAPGLDRRTQGRLRLIRSRYLHSTGSTEAAMAEAEAAVRGLEGLERVEALRLSTIVADDLQTSQRAETYAALGEAEAWAANAPAEAGSMLTLRGRTLSRIGLPREADRVFEVGLALLDRSGGENQKFTGRLNKAYMQLDQGEARSAEAGFDRLREEALALEGPVSQAHKEAYWARAGFAVGRPAHAIEAAERAEAAAESLNAPVLGFLAAIARAEGALYFERFEEALAAADTVLEFALSSLPVWENRARILRARALTGLGRLDEATEEAGRALEQTPPGIDGLRLRKEIEVVRLLALPAGSPWPQKDVEDLTDELLQSRWNLPALELMIERSKREKDPELALSAAGLAIELGLPTVAIRAGDAAKIWGDPGGQAVAFAADGVASHLPDSWADWKTLPHVAAALGVEVVDDQAATEELTAKWAQVVSDSGLAGYEVLSPAQRRAQGLVRRRAVTSVLRRVLAVAAIIVVAGGVSLGVALAVGGNTPPTTLAGPTTTATTTTTTLALENRVLATPAASFTGQTELGVNVARTGYMGPSVEGPPTAGGYFWRISTADQNIAAPIMFGQWVFVASTDNKIYAIDTRDGSELWSYQAGDAMRASPTIGQISEAGVAGQGGNRTIIAFGDDGGTLYFRDYLARSSGPFWSMSTDGTIVGAPLLLDPVVVFVSSRPDSAQVIAVAPIAREVRWTFTGMGEEPMGPVRAAPAYSNGIIYVTTTGDFGRLYLIDAETGEGICESQPLGDLAYHPVIVDGVVYLAGSTGQVYALKEGSCSSIPDNRTLVYQFGNGVTGSPVVIGDLMIVPTLNQITAIDANSSDPNAYEWIFRTPAMIQSGVVVAGEAVYFGDNNGTVYAVKLHPDSQDGELLWTWQTGNSIQATPVVLNGVVIVAGTDTTVTAIGPGAPGEEATTTTTTSTTIGGGGGTPTTTTLAPGETTTTNPNSDSGGSPDGGSDFAT